MVERETKVLIVALETWSAIARVPKALRQAGFTVAALCPQGSFLGSTRWLNERFYLVSRRLGGRICRQVVTIIQHWRPVLVVPGDDRTVLFFQGMIRLHRAGKLPLPPEVVAVLQSSFGNFDWQAEATSKGRTLQRAQLLGLKTPRFAEVHSADEAVKQAQVLGWPVVLKKSTSSGGGGVRFCEQVNQVVAVYRKFSKDVRWEGKLEARLFQASGWSLGPDWFPADFSVTVNESVQGREAMLGVAAVNGRVLAHLAAIKVECHPGRKGPSSVIEFIPHAGMLHTAETLIATWGATGWMGFDFMLSADGEAHLLECNARPISLTYMDELAGSCLGTALHQHLIGGKQPDPSSPRHKLVAHFPNEWRRDPSSPYLTTAYHDVPWDDSDLLQKLWTS